MASIETMIGGLAVASVVLINTILYPLEFDHTKLIPSSEVNPVEWSIVQISTRVP